MKKSLVPLLIVSLLVGCNTMRDNLRSYENDLRGGSYHSTAVTTLKLAEKKNGDELLWRLMAGNSSALAGDYQMSIDQFDLAEDIFIKNDNRSVFSSTGQNTRAMLVNDKEITYKSRYSTISFTVNNRLMTLNNVQYYLARPIVKNQYSFLIGKSDFELILEPILRPTIINPKRPVRTILIDPGHGGKDVGAVNGKDYEKDINLAVALRLANKLSARGFRIYMTRNKDSELSLDKRTRFANTIDADLFISIHCNSASPSANGLETYIATPRNDPPVGSTTVYKDNCPANKYDKANAYLAFYTQRSILQRTGVADRGVRRKRYYVIRNTNCPSMLIEIGFISSKFELANLKNPVYQEKITDGIVEGVLKYREAVK